MLIYEVKPKFFMKMPHKHQYFRRAIFKILNYSGKDREGTPWFEQFIVFCILVNLVVLAMPYQGMSDQYELLLEYINIVLLVVFTIELILKFIVFQLSYFFRDFWNKFDFVIVLGSIFALLLKYYGKDGAGLGASTLIVRTFRICRIFRLVQYDQFDALRSLNILFQTFLITIPQMINVTFLLILFFYIYSVMGVELFATVMFNYPLNENVNFRTVGSSMLTLMRVSTGEDWQAIMHAVSRSEHVLY